MVMTWKERMLSAIRGEPTDRIPWVPRLDLWYRANRRAGTLPAQYADADLMDIVDDLVVYRMGEGECRLVVNAANIEKDWAHMTRFAGDFEAELYDESDGIALLALQGPLARDVLAPLTGADLDRIGFYHFAQAEVAGVPAVISRTGYTGEDGFELYVEAGDGPPVWRALLESEIAVTPAGLGARDTLRLEMGYALYGSDIDQGTTPLEARLGWLVRLDKGEFVGRELAMLTVEPAPEARAEVLRISEIFRGKIVDVGQKSLVIEVTGSQDKLDAMARLLEPLGLADMVRTGPLAAPRSTAK